MSEPSQKLEDRRACPSAEPPAQVPKHRGSSSATFRSIPASLRELSCLDHMKRETNTPGVSLAAAPRSIARPLTILSSVRKRGLAGRISPTNPHGRARSRSPIYFFFFAAFFFVPFFFAAFFLAATDESPPRFRSSRYARSENAPATGLATAMRSRRPSFELPSARGGLARNLSSVRATVDNQSPWNIQLDAMNEDKYSNEEEWGLKGAWITRWIRL